MRLNALRLQNFRQHLDTQITFEGGLTGVIGANGAGKSTILEAIAWALYGTPAARGNRETIRSLRAGPRAAVRVELDFELGGHRYLVTRGLTTAELYLDGAGTPIANSLTGVTELLRRRLGMSREEFFNTYFTGQKELSVMAAMGPADRAQFLSRVLGYERLRAAQGLARERRKVVVAEAAGLRSGMPDAEQVQRQIDEAARRLADAERRALDAARRRTQTGAALTAVEPRWQAAQRSRERLQELLGELRVAESERANAAREVDRVARELAMIADAREELARIAPPLARLTELASDLRVLDALYREEGRRQTLAESERALREELAQLRERHAKLESAPALEREATTEVERRRQELAQAEAALEAKRTEWVRDKQEAETKLQALRAQYDDVREQKERLVHAGEDGTCPTCARPLGGHFRSVLDTLDEQLETVRVDGKYYKSRLEQLEAVPPEVTALEERRRQAFEDATRLERRLAKCQSAVAELAQLGRELGGKQQRHEQVRRDLATIPEGYDAVRHAALQRELERLKPLETRASRLSSQLEREPQLGAEQARAAERLRGAEARAADLEARRATLAFDERQFGDLRAEYEKAAAELRAAELAAVGAESDRASAELARETAAQALRELEAAQRRLAALVSERALHDELDRAYTEMRTDLNMQLRPEISDRASRFLSELTDGRYSELELDESYNFVVLEDGIPKPVISGGEEDLANLVLRLAISQMIAERAGQPLNLLILDEVFGSLDETRRHNVVELLRRLHDRFEQVILITHIDAVREGLDQVITVHYDEETGSSRVVQERPDGSAMLDAGDAAHDLAGAER
ncbi:MAG TPA: SMC family ATPase [Gemmatimonadaceae bacterium]|nr:SMC family ATPase [Gemmatimonadaceae bacterium]